MLSQHDMEGDTDAHAGHPAFSDRVADAQLSRIRAASKDGEGDVGLLPVSVITQRLTALATISTGDPKLDAMAHGVALARLRDLRS